MVISRLKFKKYKVTVPKTKDMQKYTIIVQDDYETYRFNALKMYNAARKQNGLKHLKRMPVGTKYKHVKNN